MSIRTGIVAMAFAVAMGAGSASAASFSVGTNHWAQGDEAIAIAAGDYSNFNPGGTWSGPGADDDPTVSPGASQGGVYLSPFDGTSAATNSYFSVGGVSGSGLGSNSPVTLTLNKAINALTILWGSLDSYNTISFDNGESATGKEVFESYAGPAGTGNYNQVALVKFLFAAPVTQITFTSTQAALEFAFSENSFSAVPVPAALPLFGTALGAMALLRYRRKRGMGSTAA